MAHLTDHDEPLTCACCGRAVSPRSLDEAMLCEDCDALEHETSERLELEQDAAQERAALEAELSAILRQHGLPERLSGFAPSTAGPATVVALARAVVVL